MTDDEINNKFDIVADLMASLAVKIDLLGDKVGGLADAQVRAEQRWERTEESIRALHAIAEIQAQEITVLGESVRALNGRQLEADERQRQADERQRQADERLNILINTVERYISERRNGES
ncbi:MAG: hypothetical protein M3371_01925 [Acidobacteriota bacterium]|nr:hypothetical protein [Acidobacteriota bacterium]